MPKMVGFKCKSLRVSKGVIRSCGNEDPIHEKALWSCVGGYALTYVRACTKKNRLLAQAALSIVHCQLI